MKLSFFLLASLVAAVPKSLSSENFDDLVHDVKKNSMIYFYQPECGDACKEIETVWEDFGILMKKSDKVVIGSMDCTLNQDLCTSLSVASTPDLLYFEHGNQPVRYTGEINLEHLHDFIKKMMHACSFENDTACTDDEKVLIAEMKKYPTRIKLVFVSGQNKFKSSVKKRTKRSNRCAAPSKMFALKLKTILKI